MTKRIVYDSNNSGGIWWLRDKDWVNLEKAGWVVDWYRNQKRSTLFNKLDSEGRWLGALAATAYRDGLSLRDAITEWEKITNEDCEAEGCPCCGPPHNFYEKEINENETSTGS